MLQKTLSQRAANEPMSAGTPSSRGWSEQVWGACGVPPNHLLTGTAPGGRLRTRAEFLSLPAGSRREL